MVISSIQETKAPFNMALATLERISDILREIRKIDADLFIPPEQKQKAKVALAKQFFINSSPLLEEKTCEKYMDTFKKLKPATTTVYSKDGEGSLKRKKELRVYFDENLEIEIDLFLLDISRELQKERYFMPPKEDLNKAGVRM